MRTNILVTDVVTLAVRRRTRKSPSFFRTERTQSTYKSLRRSLLEFRVVGHNGAVTVRPVTGVGAQRVGTRLSRGGVGPTWRHPLPTSPLLPKCGYTGIINGFNLPRSKHFFEVSPSRRRRLWSSFRSRVLVLYLLELLNRCEKREKGQIDFYSRTLPSPPNSYFTHLFHRERTPGPFSSVSGPPLYLPIYVFFFIVSCVNIRK